MSGIGANISMNELAPGSATPGDTMIDRSLGWERHLLCVKTTTTLAGTLANGTVVYFVPGSAGTYVITDDISDSHVNLVAGVAIGAITTGGYVGWIQTWGKCTALKKPGVDSIDSVSVGTQFHGNTSTDGSATKVANGTAPPYKPFAQAITAATSTATTVVALIQLAKASK